MPFWHEQVAAWQAGWSALGLPAHPRITLTPPDQEGVLTFNIFPLLRAYKGDAERAARAVLACVEDVARSQVVRGFVNVSFTPEFWHRFLEEVALRAEAGYTHLTLAAHEKLMVEYPSPNTNKPLHLGHLRNLCLGEAVCRLWERVGAQVIRANLVNDRGIHISKSMLGWKKFFAPATPQTTGKKGDHFVGDCYVAFEKAYRAEVEALKQQGLSEEEALVQAPLFQEAQALLRAWEAGDPETWALWRQMNEWVYEGFEATFQRMGVRFDRVYYESETYKLGKKVVEEGLARGLFYREEDGSVWADLTPEGLGKKLLLRRDGTSVYLTQDLGTADLKFQDYPDLTRSVYVIGNEQDHHMRLLVALLRRLGRPYAEALYHLSYGMVELPTGRMKTREGTVVDADDLLDEMHSRALELVEEGLPAAERHAIAEAVGQAALRFYLLRVDPTKNIVFDPAESIELKGFTGPFLQYGLVRAQRLLEKAAEKGFDPRMEVPPPIIEPTEEKLLQQLYGLPEVLVAAARSFDPALLAHYGYELTRRYNEFYQTLPVLAAEPRVRSFRLSLTQTYKVAMETVMETLSLPVPSRM